MFLAILKFMIMRKNIQNRVRSGIQVSSSCIYLNPGKNIDMGKLSRDKFLQVVTAIREFLQAVDTYQKIIQLNDEDKDNLLSLQCKIAGTKEIGCLFLLLLRQYNGKLQSRQYLQDLILTNHIYLLFLDNISKLREVKPKLSLMEHLKR